MSVLNWMCGLLFDDDGDAAEGISLPHLSKAPLGAAQIYCYTYPWAFHMILLLDGYESERVTEEEEFCVCVFYASSEVMS